MITRFVCVVFVVGFASCIAGLLAADDWASWRGPNQNGQAVASTFWSSNDRLIVEWNKLEKKKPEKVL